VLQQLGLSPEALARLTAPQPPPAPPAHPTVVEARLPKDQRRLNGAAPGEKARPRPKKERGPLITVRRQPSEPVAHDQDPEPAAQSGAGDNRSALA
jgi:hypothetical protein